MEVNELNKMNVVAQFNKLISQTNFMGADGESFAGILEKNTSDLSFVSSKNETVSQKDAVKTPASENKEKVSAQDKTENKNKAEKENATDKDNKVSEKEEAQTTEKEDSVKEKEDNTKDEEEKKNVKTSAQEPVLPLQVACLEGTTPVEEVTSESDVVPALEELPKGILAKDMQIIDQEGNILALSDLSLEEISAQDSFKIINPQTMQEAEVSGEQLAQIISELSSEAPVDVAEMAPVLEKVAETVSAPVKKANSAQTNAVENIVAEDAVLPEKGLEEKAELDTLLADKSVKVDLTVKEEKISYAENKSLVKDALSLQEVAENVEALPEEQPVAQQATAQVKTANGNANTTINAAMPQNMAAAADDKAATVQNIAVSEVKQASSAAHTGQAIVSGSEFLASAKAENAGKSNQTSLNDVYKGMSKEAVEQVKVNITKSAVKGVDTIEVRLKPEELGHIEIKMQIKNGKLQAHIISSRPETMEALQRDAQVLEKAFNDAGFQTDSNSLSFSFRNEGNQAQEQSNQLRNFIGKVFEQEANSDVVAAEAANQNWSAENGLNIRV